MIAVAACGSQPAGPVDAARSWFQAVIDLDLARVRSLTCSPDVTALDEALAASGGLNADADLTRLRAQVIVEVDGLTFVETAVNGEQAVVRVTGSLGSRQVAQEIQLIKEDGIWKLCPSGAPSIEEETPAPH